MKIEFPLFRVAQNDRFDYRLAFLGAQFWGIDFPFSNLPEELN